MTSAGKILIDAIKSKDLPKVQRLLSLGVSPNARLVDQDRDGDAILSRLDALTQAVSNDDNSTHTVEANDSGSEGDSNDDPPPAIHNREEDFHDEQVRQEWYPIQHAAYIPNCTAEDRYHKSNIMNAILEHGPDLLAVFNGKYRRPIAHQLAFIDFDELGGSCQDNLYSTEYQQDNVVRGPRTLLHSMLEDGAYVHPILMHPLFRELNLEARDQQGRTILLAACRSFTGCSTDLRTSVRDVYVQRGYSSWRWRIDPSGSGEAKGFAAFLIENGSNPYAIDHNQKNAAHHLFESFDPIEPDRMPYIGTTHDYLEKNHARLFVQSDSAGLHPIHTALRRYMWYYHIATAQEWDGYQYRDELGAFIAERLHSQWSVRDSQGNTALHYLAGLDFWAHWDPNPVQDLFFRLLEADPGLAHRNHNGRTALEILLLDRPYACSLSVVNSISGVLCSKTEREVEDLIWSTLDSACVDWLVTDGASRTLLHLLAAIDCTSSKSRVFEKISRLLQRGVDPGAVDSRGITAYSTAVNRGNMEAIRALRDLPGGQIPKN